jgi:hypothetical protein
VATLPELMDSLVADDWRKDNPILPDLAECHSELLHANNSEERAALLNA